MNTSSLDQLDWRPINAGNPDGPLWVKVTHSQWAEYLSISPYKCDHPRSEVRERTIANGSIQWRKQCLTCGLSRSDAIKREANEHVTPWDNDLEKSYEKSIRGQRATLESEFIEQTLAIETGAGTTYNKYLKSNEWKQKRTLVLERDKNLCQGCLQAKASEVHHLSYDDVPNELMFDLVSLCRACHERVHRRKIAKLQKLKEASHNSHSEESAE